ncbi:MAG: sugar ABC transporter permease [Christensenellaceae bacterium]|nr:sugar ABC transporter permease [Christensenellaceae bacterium]
MPENKRKKRIKPENMLIGGSWLDRHFPQVLSAPSIIVLVIVMAIPIGYSIILSFSKLNLSNQTMSFVGLDNYVKLFSDGRFLNSMGITLAFTFITVFLEIALGIAIALVLNKKFKGRGFVRGLMILPWALPGVVNAIMWKWIFNANYGPLNALLTQTGIIDSYQLWLGQPVSAFFCVVFADLWKETPYVVLLTIAALATIPNDLYEAASIDGAGGWRSFWKITLPQIKPVVVVLVITKVIWALQTYDLIYIMTAGGPVNATEFITLLIQRTAIKYSEFGYASAMSYMLSIICFFLTYLYIKIFMRGEEDGGIARSSKMRKLSASERRKRGAVA